MFRKGFLFSLLLLLVVLLIVGRYMSAEGVVWETLALDIRMFGAAFLMGISTVIFVMVLAPTIFIVVKFKEIIDWLKRLLMRSGGIQDENPLGALAALAYWIFVIALVLLLYRIGLFPSDFLSPKNVGDAGIKINVPLPAGAGSSEVTITIPSDAAVLMSFLLNASMILLICFPIIFALLIFKAFRKASKDRVSINEGVLEKVYREVLEAVKEAVTDIERKEDYRKAIIKCYQRMCDLLVRLGLRIQKHQTAREFKRVVEEVLIDIPKNSLQRLTELFEEARYGHHEISEQRRLEALDCLKEIEAFTARAIRGTSL